jgi:hypothetical protein
MIDLQMPKVEATVQMATVNIPFKVIIQNEERLEELVLKDLVKRVLHWRWWFRYLMKSDLPWRARGVVKWFDKTHGYIDHGKFYMVPLTGKAVWSRRGKPQFVLSGVIPHIGRYCFTGWGLCSMEIHDDGNNTVLKVEGRVISEIYRLNKQGRKEVIE